MRPQFLAIVTATISMALAAPIHSAEPTDIDAPIFTANRGVMGTLLDGLRSGRRAMHAFAYGNYNPYANYGIYGAPHGPQSTTVSSAHIDEPTQMGK
jgi:hypothetical protein